MSRYGFGGVGIEAAMLVSPPLTGEHEPRHFFVVYNRR